MGKKNRGSLTEKNGSSNFKKRLLDILELPEEVVLSTPKIDILGSECIYIENYNSIKEFKNDLIRVNTSLGEIKISGERLMLKKITDEMLVIDGEVEIVGFPKTGVRR